MQELLRTLHTSVCSLGDIEALHEHLLCMQREFSARLACAQELSELVQELPGYIYKCYTEFA